MRPSRATSSYPFCIGGRRSFRRHVTSDPAIDEAHGVTYEASEALFDQVNVIFGFRPSTHAGVVALLRYIGKLKDWQSARGLEDPNSTRAVQTLCTSIAAALEQLGVTT